MGLRAKFNLVILAAFAVGFLVAAVEHDRGDEKPDGEGSKDHEVELGSQAHSSNSLVGKSAAARTARGASKSGRPLYHVDHPGRPDPRPRPQSRAPVAVPRSPLAISRARPIFIPQGRPKHKSTAPYAGTRRD